MTRLKDPSLIEKELDDQFEAKGLKNRAALFTLIVYTTTDDRAKYIFQLLSKLVEKFPCRIIFIHEEEKYKDPITFDVRSDFHPEIPCDLIEILIGPKDREKTPFIILPLLLPDIPTFLLWGSDPSIPNEILTKLSEHADRIIFDSICVHNLAQFASRMLEMHSPKLRDVNWAALSGWRKALITTIDNPDEIKAISKAKIITITYNSHSSPGLPHPEIQARYLNAWLQAKLKWEKIEVVYKPQESREERPGDILALDIAGENNTFFSFVRKGLNCSIHIEYEDFCQMPQNFPLTPVKRGFTFWRELFFEGVSPDYFLMLEKLKHGI